MSASAKRDHLGGDAVVSEAEAVRRLPFRAARAREWLRERGLVREVPSLGRCVVWGDVLDAVRLVDDEPPDEPAPRSTLPRAGLRPRRR